MKEKKWLTATDLSDMLASVRDHRRNSVGVAGEIGLGVSDMLASVRNQDGGHRRVRLFACACLRRVWNLLNVEGARRIVQLAEGYADGEASAAELQTTTVHASFDGFEDRFHGLSEPRLSIRAGEAITAAQWLASATFNTSDAAAIASTTSKDPTRDYFRKPEWMGQPAGVPPSVTERAEQVKLLWDIFGNPFRPISVDPSWLTSTTVSLARQMYESRDFSPMPILADALQDAGCDNEHILSHCRQPGEHVRGCWVVDLILDKS